MDTTLVDPLIGRVLDRRYRVDACLARGGMGTVYTATDLRLDRIVAVKVLQPMYAADPTFVARFIREARAAARLSHPNVVAVFDQGSEPAPAGGLPVVFLVMEYVAGRTLRALLAERGALPPSSALALMEPVLSALTAAHAAGLVHRDVKPENVLLADDGRTKVADFGLARAIETSPGSSSVTMLLGTVAYLPPEQISRGCADARSDVYAAGVVLYELLTGSPPLPADTAMAVAFRHVSEDVPPPSRAVPSLPPAVDDLVATATDREPEQRFADAAAFLRALRTVRAGLPGVDGERPTVAVPRAAPPDPRPVRTAPVPPPPAGPRPVIGSPPRRRRRAGGWGTAGVVLVLAALAVGAGWWAAVGRFAAAPAVLAMTKTTATRTLDQAGLNAQWLPDRFSPTVPAGRVAYEQPAPGQRVRRGGTVQVALSKGPEVHALPALAGQPLADAQRVLQSYGLRYTTTKAYSNTVSSGQVVSTRPGPGTRLHPGDLVRVTVSKGRRPVTVPDVRGLARPDAEAVLAKAGFAIERQEAYDDTVVRGDIVSVDPKPGDKAPYGSTVTLVVSRGPELFPVPDVRGASVGDAQRMLEKAGFRVRVFQPLGFGSVRLVSPKVGTMVAKNTTITILAY